MTEHNSPPEHPVIPFRQPRPVLRWLAVLLAAGGWYVSMQLMLVSAGGEMGDPLLVRLCGTDEQGAGGCDAVLTSPQAYISVGQQPGALRIPVSTLALGFYTFVGLWYALIGPPTRAGRYWHLLIGLIVLGGAWESVSYIRMMGFELHRWCAGCLVAHAINGALLIVTVLAWPWRAPRDAAPTVVHPSGRLALATAIAGGFSFLTHLAVVYVMVAGMVLKTRTAEYVAVLDDPQFIVWDHARQPVCDLPVDADEAWRGSVDAPHTLIVISDLQCTACRSAHRMIDQVLERFAGRLRVAYRYYPQDPACNSNPKYRGGGHASGCAAARAVLAARAVDGEAGQFRLQSLIFERNAELPAEINGEAARQCDELLLEWAAEAGLPREELSRAIDSPAVVDRLARDIEIGERLDIAGVPVLYLDGRRLRHWSKLETWEVLLGASGAETQPAGE